MFKKVIAYFKKTCYCIIKVDEGNKVSTMDKDMDKKINRNIIENSYYMIKLFIDENKDITNLKLQKLMYFVEAYYMVKNSSEPYLYESEWSAWNYGPVIPELYQEYKKFGSLPITITEEQKEKAENLPDKNKEYIESIYKILGDLSAFDLVTLTHLDGSPWSYIYKNQKYDFEDINNKSIISKKQTAKWFEEKFDFIFSED